jgi:hypothetical protein
MLHDPQRHRARDCKGSTIDGTAPAISAELFGDDRAVALGIQAQSSAPVLALCRALVAAGHDPASPLHAYRAETLALQVRSIGEGAALDIVDSRFQKWHPRKPSAASPIAQTARPHARVRPDASEALGRARRTAARRAP